MKTKTIEKVLQKKITEWIDTIQDSSVRDLAKKNTIVTGGSIASMLLNEKVNDFDIYFRTKETVKAIAAYYAKSVPGLQVCDSSVLWKEIQVAKQSGETDQWSVFLRNLDAGNRVAIFCPGVGYHSVTGEGSLMAEPEEVEQTKGIFEQINETKKQVEVGSYSPLFFTENAITLSGQTQLVLRFYGEAKELHKNYDFAHATNYYDNGDGKLHTNSLALESLLAKELRYIGSLYPVTSIIRTKKFIKRGWTITAGEYLKIMFQVSELDLKNVDVLQSQLLGVDVAYFSILIEALTNRDTTRHEKVTYPYICELIDRIFN